MKIILFDELLVLFNRHLDSSTIIWAEKDVLLNLLQFLVAELLEILFMTEIKLNWGLLLSCFCVGE